MLDKTVKLLYAFPMKKTTNHFTPEALGHSFSRVAAQLSTLDSHASCDLQNETFVTAEMHLVKLIHEEEGLHITALAQKLGVTKSAVSQLAAKLERKGILKKGIDPQNHARLMLYLTEKGERLYDIHESFHQELDALVAETLQNASEENRQFSQQFLDAVEQKILAIHMK